MSVENVNPFTVPPAIGKQFLARVWRKTKFQ